MKNPVFSRISWFTGLFLFVARGGLELKFSCKKTSKIKEFYNAVILKVIKSHQLLMRKINLRFWTNGKNLWEIKEIPLYSDLVISWIILILKSVIKKSSINDEKEQPYDFEEWKNLRDQRKSLTTPILLFSGSFSY